MNKLAGFLNLKSYCVDVRGRWRTADAARISINSERPSLTIKVYRFLEKSCMILYFM